MTRILGTAVAAAVVATFAVSCGASSKQVKQAKLAEYSCEYAEVLQATADVLAEQFPPLLGVDRSTGVVASDFRWHDPYGKRLKPGAAVAGEGYVSVAGEAIVERTDNGWRVRAQARILGHVVGSPRGQEYKHDDPRWPTWADAKIDNFFVKVYERLRRCDVNAPAENKKE